MERVSATDPDRYRQGAPEPELAIEIVSPSETARTLNRKVDALLAAGSRAVWVVYADERKVRVFLPDGTSHRSGPEDALTFPELLPGWEVPVAKLLESVGV